MFMTCIVLMNKLFFLKVCRKYDGQFISVMHMHKNQDLMSM